MAEKEAARFVAAHDWTTRSDDEPSYIIAEVGDEGGGEVARNVLMSYMRNNGMQGRHIGTVPEGSCEELRQMAYGEFDEESPGLVAGAFGREALRRDDIEDVAIIIRKDGEVVRTRRQFWIQFANI